MRVIEAAAESRSEPPFAPSGFAAAIEPGSSPGLAGCPELECLRERLPAHVLAAAAGRSERLGIGADRVLIASGEIGEEEYVRALGTYLGLAFVPLDGTPLADCTLSRDRMIDLASFGLLPLFSAARPVVVIAPRNMSARRLSVAVNNDPALAQTWRLTTGERLTRFVVRCAGPALAHRAAERLREDAPALSAAPLATRGYGWVTTFAAAFGLAAIAPAAALAIAEFTLGAVFLGWLALRLAGIALPPPRASPLARIPDAELPVYTVLAALYREARSVDALLHAIAVLDYPREKLDVILAVEADDSETLAAIAARTTSLPVTVVPIAPGQPRTKPRALNAALAFAQGTFTVVFDAEDRPDPDQLRRALAAFAESRETLACVQARLTIDNTEDSWLTRGIMAQTPQALNPVTA